MIVVTFAVPHESRDFRRVLRQRRRLGKDGTWLGNVGHEEVLVAHTGIGIVAAEANVRALLTEHRPALLISAGYAGSLDARLALGDLLIATNHSAPEWVQRCRARCGSAHLGMLTTHPRLVESAAEKAVLARATGALAVDMETSGIAGVAHEFCVPILAVRAISDAATEPVPLPLEVSYDVEAQRPRPVVLLKYLALHPRQIVPFVRFVRGLATARTALTNFLVELLTDSRTH